MTVKFRLLQLSILKPLQAILSHSINTQMDQRVSLQYPSIQGKILIQESDIRKEGYAVNRMTVNTRALCHVYQQHLKFQRVQRL
jgi:hypothetical protein